MLTRPEFENAVDAHVTAAMDLAKHGHMKESMGMVRSLISLTWELTRPDAQCLHRDISYAIPDEVRDKMVELHINVIVDEEGAAMMAWGQGKNRDGNDMFGGSELPDGWHERMTAIIDAELKEHFSHLDMSKVSSMDEALGKIKGKPTTTTHVEVTKEAIDKAAAEFNEEFDRLFSVWEGGDDSG